MNHTTLGLALSGFLIAGLPAAAAEITDFADLAWKEGAKVTFFKFGKNQGTIFTPPKESCLTEIIMVNPTHDMVEEVLEEKPDKKLLVILTE